MMGDFYKRTTIQFDHREAFKSNKLSNLCSEGS